MKNITPTKHYGWSSTLHQLCKLIPSHLTEKLAREYGVDKKARTFTPWSHVVSLLFAQLTHAIGLNDVCDTLRHQSSGRSGERLHRAETLFRMPIGSATAT